MLTRFCLYGFLKNQRYFEPFLMLAFLQKGLSFFWIGMLVACHSLTVNVLEVPSGAIADSWGRRGSMISSFSAYIACFITFAFADHIGWLFLAMVLYGIGDSFRTGTHKAMIFEWLRLQGRENERTKIYGLTRSWSKFGSAVSSVLAAIFVIMTGNYQSIFLFATIPYALNIVNFLGYPRELDGVKEATVSFSTTWTTLVSSLKTAVARGPLRRLMAESMGWEGVFHAVKDYLQPVLAAVVIGFLAPTDVSSSDVTKETAVLIGLTYTVLFVLSGFASRTSHRFVARLGSEDRAAGRLWLLNLIMYALLAWAAWQGSLALVALMFVAMHVLQNIWRPVLISRLDQHSDPARGATILSIESQAHRLATLIVAPIAGFMIDRVAVFGAEQKFWPIGVLGGLAALIMWQTPVQFRAKR